LIVKCIFAAAGKSFDRVWDRYDLDGSGTINDNEEAEQLTRYLLYTLNGKQDVISNPNHLRQIIAWGGKDAEITEICSKYESLVHAGQITMTSEGYVVWFEANFLRGELGNGTNGSSPSQEVPHYHTLNESYLGKTGDEPADEVVDDTSDKAVTESVTEIELKGGLASEIATNSNYCEFFLENEPSKDDTETFHPWCTVNSRDEDENVEEAQNGKKERDPVFMFGLTYRELTKLIDDGSPSRLMSEIDWTENSLVWNRWRLGIFIESAFMKGLMTFLIIANGICLGVQADHAPESAGWMYLEVFFVAMFLLELGIKVFAYRGMYWTDPWNIIDFGVVAVSTAELTLVLTIGHQSSGFSALRLIRIVRVVRLVTFVTKLNILMNSFIDALRSAIWAFALVILALYTFAILGKSFFGDSGTLKNQYPEAADRFSTIPRSMAALVQVMTFDNWTGLVVMQICDALPLAWIYWIAFIVFVALGLMNLFTGVFLQTLLEQYGKHNSRKKKLLLKQRQKLLKSVSILFRNFDVDKGGTLDVTELPSLLEACREEGTLEMLQRVGLPYEKLHRATQIADYDHSLREYDPKARVTYEVGHRPAPADFDRAQLLTDETNVLPEGVTEFELVDCLTRLDDPMTIGEYFALMKRMRLMDRRMRGMETCMRNMEGSMAEVLDIIQRKLK